MKDLPETGNPQDQDIYFAYDNHGRLLSARYGSESGDGVIQSYDGLGRLESRSVFGRTIGYQYDAASHPWIKTYPGPGTFWVKYNYTVAGELHTIEDSTGTVLATFEYDALGRRTSLTRPNGAVTSYQYDGIGRLTTLTQDLAGTAYDGEWGLTYAPSGQIIGRSQTNDAAYTWMPPTPNSTVSAQFDGQNRLTNFSNSAVSVGPNGEVGSLIGNTYSYDQQGQLIKATVNGQEVNLEYDPMGMLSKVTANNTETEFLYDGPHLIAQYRGSTLLNRFVYADGIDEPIVQYAGEDTSNRKYLFADERGSIVTVSDSAGLATASTKYSSFGHSETAPLSKFGYTGQVWLDELELYYYKARMYSPRTGRFMQPDPLGYADGLNLYAYVNGDPINLRDPLGLEGFGEVIVPGPRCKPDDPDPICAVPNPCMAMPIICGLFIPIVTPSDASSNSANSGGGGEPHHYIIKTPTTCTADDAFSGVRAQSAPGAPPAIEDGATRHSLSPLVPWTFLHAILPNYFTRPNPITQIVDTRQRILLNVAEKGHVFYPGTVITTVKPSGTGSVIETVGDGTGEHPIFNDLVGIAYFGLRNYFVQTGCDAANGIPNNY